MRFEIYPRTRLALHGPDAHPAEGPYGWRFRASDGSLRAISTRTFATPDDARQDALDFDEELPDTGLLPTIVECPV
jgi:hypothetical protein